MKANSKRKVFGDAVDLLMGDMEEVTMPRGVQMVPVKNIQAFHDHPFHLYEGERLEDMIASVKEHGVLNPVIVQKLDTGYEMLSGHNRWNAAKLAGIKEIPAIVKTDLSEEEAYVYVIETNLMQRSFSDLAISEKAAVLKARYEKEACQGKRNDILEEIARLEGKEISITRGHDDHRLKTRDMIGKEYELSGSSVGRLHTKDRAHAAERGYGAKWQRERRKFLESNPFCVKCYEEGHITMATVVDHIVPHRGDQKLFWDRGNWQPLCEHHHNVKTMTEDRYVEYKF